MNNYSRIVISILLLFIIASWVHISNLQSQINENQQLSQAIVNKSKSIPGKTCTQLSYEDAQNWLNSDVTRGITNVVSTVGEEETYRHIDGCEYTSKDHSLFYIDYIIYTYEDEEIAAARFEKDLPQVGDREDINKPEYYADEVVYVEGLIVMRQGDQVIQVSAGNGSPSTAREFTIEVFESLINTDQPNQTVITALNSL